MYYVEVEVNEQFAIEAMAFIVSFPTKDGDFTQLSQFTRGCPEKKKKTYYFVDTYLQDRGKGSYLS